MASAGFELNNFFAGRDDATLIFLIKITQGVVSSTPLTKDESCVKHSDRMKVIIGDDGQLFQCWNGTFVSHTALASNSSESRPLTWISGNNNSD